MGQKVHPIGFRLGINKDWTSKWYAEKNFGKLLQEDLTIRKYLKKKLYQAGISKIEIERATNKIKINIFTSRPGMVIGRKGSEIDQLKKELQNITDKEVYINIHEVKKRALEIGIDPGKMNKGDLIRTIQEAEGNPPSFGNNDGSCLYDKCRWWDDCIKEHKKK